MDRIFWVECPTCNVRWYVDWALRNAKHALECPKCQCKFRPEQAPWLDERPRP